MSGAAPSLVAARAVDWPSFRAQARALLAAAVPPSSVAWEDPAQPSLFGAAPPPPPVAEAVTKVPAAFVAQAEVACDHADPNRFASLYRLLWKLTHGTPKVLSDPLDPDAARVTAMVREVHGEEHDLHAFIRFRRTESPDGAERYVAWYRPKNHVLARVAPFFARRYPHQPWSLFTPEASAHWDGHALTFGPGAPRASAPGPDELDGLFLTYYESVYNPARANLAAMSRHMPAHVQSQLQEGAVARRLAQQASGRVARLAPAKTSASALVVPASRELDVLRGAAASCTACPLASRATQTVFGEGPRDARLMLVGEQPGDEEDLQGRPFVGPAGRLLDDLMSRAGLPRTALYVTNAVKHFKWEPRGRRRIHAKPNQAEVEACHGWLLAEIDAVRPEMILCLGATAAQAFAGTGFRVQRDRGRASATPWAPWWMASYHPSALLRAGGDVERAAIEAALLADLTAARDHLATLPPRAAPTGASGAAPG